MEGSSFVRKNRVYWQHYRGSTLSSANIVPYIALLTGSNNMIQERSKGKIPYKINMHRGNRRKKHVLIYDAYIGIHNFIFD